jgi:stress response protein SCP2
MRNRILIKSVVHAVIVASGLFLGCTDLLDPTVAEEPITFSGFSAVSASPGNPGVIQGTIADDAGVDSVTVTVTAPDGTRFGNRSVLYANGSSSYSLTYSLSVVAGDCIGTYMVAVVAYSNGKWETKTVGVTVTGAKDCSEPEVPVLTVGSLSGSGAVTPLAPAGLTATVTCTHCTATPSATVRVTDSAGTTAVGVSAVVSYSSAASVTVTAVQTACNGTYTVTLTVTSGALSQTRTSSVTVSGATDCNAPTGDLTVSTNLVLGAQSNAAGSSLDVDAFAVLTSANAKASAAGVDCIAGYSMAFDSIKIGSPKWALDNAFSVANGWPTYNTNVFKAVQTRIDMHTATESAMKTAWAAGAGAVSSFTCGVGKQFLTVTTGGAIAVIEVTAVTNGASGSVTFRVGRTRAGVETPPIPESPATLTEASLSLGADQNTTLGSSLDLDVPSVLLATAARNSAAQVDLIYANSFATNSDKLGSPLWAQNNVSFVANWAVYNDTKFYKPAGTTYESVTTPAQLSALWNVSRATASSIDVVADDVIIAKTNEGAIVLIKIVTQTPGATGRIDIKVAK